MQACVCAVWGSLLSKDKGEGKGKGKEAGGQVNVSGVPF